MNPASSATTEPMMTVGGEPVPIGSRLVVHVQSDETQWYEVFVPGSGWHEATTVTLGPPPQ